MPWVGDLTRRNARYSIQGRLSTQHCAAESHAPEQFGAALAVKQAVLVALRLALPQNIGTFRAEEDHRDGGGRTSLARVGKLRPG